MGWGRENQEFFFGCAIFWMLLNIEGTRESGAEDIKCGGIYSHRAR